LSYNKIKDIISEKFNQDVSIYKIKKILNI
jgi:hypothetical protein